ncbi:MAG: Glu-tRNA(Gln) amidotransferase GatDE subunit E [Thermoprotei archaeon]|nr:MAG: Glu-tRNA(Gln) amidotransferase GatDE subunit E [Thermoprotei archaeon]
MSNARPNYKDLELRVGFEIHQQLDTEHKLFCNCPTRLVSDEELRNSPRFVRFLRATKSELGEVDEAAAFEERRKRVFEYIAPSPASCLVELDEEPPHEMNREALLIGIAIAKALNANIVDEVHVMRKIVIDGSNTAGFQRTAIIALGGYIDDPEGRVGIQTIAIEEDAARKIEERNGIVVYSLDRLGIPLIEISTAPDVKSPEQARRVAEKIGLLLRLTGKVKRGIGTIRQDINISIKGAPKIEVKGVQRLELIPKVIENEVRRILGLLKIKEELLQRGVTEEQIQNRKPIDITDILLKSSSGFIKRSIRRGAKAYAVCLPKFGGILGRELQLNRRFGTELADYVRQWSGVGGLIHSDELPGYGIDKNIVESIKEKLGCGDNDAFVIVVDQEPKALDALNVVKWRCIEALRGIPRETRAANPDGTTRYMRPQPGAARMYPETDIPPITITEELLREAEKYRPPTPDEKAEEIIKKFAISRALAWQLIHSEYLNLFEELATEFGNKVPPTVIATTLVSTLKSLLAEGLDINKITDEHLRKLFAAVAQGKISKEAIPEVLKLWCKEPALTIDKIIDKLSLKPLTLEDLTRIVDEILMKHQDYVLSRGERAFGLIMGQVMKVVRGKIDGKTVAETVKKRLHEFLEKKIT